MPEPLDLEPSRTWHQNLTKRLARSIFADAEMAVDAAGHVGALLAEVDRLRGFEAAVRAAHKSGWERRATAGRVLDDIGGALDALEAARGCGRGDA